MLGRGWMTARRAVPRAEYFAAHEATRCKNLRSLTERGTDQTGRLAQQMGVGVRVSSSLSSVDDLMARNEEDMYSDDTTRMPVGRHAEFEDFWALVQTRNARSWTSKKHLHFRSERRLAVTVSPERRRHGLTQVARYFSDEYFGRSIYTSIRAPLSYGLPGSATVFDWVSTSGH
ncbi:hypothetical protein EXIGLDRAFT_807989 [Exidia glandulosa HHB12029]|uniref:Uncharacterized protein n=1 Tax=Exidia glandulosa HHB12029 TaxID=1314781 RepID=A0A165D4U6_EXIGL|nr:hypothetical protein EXIGLDRAFT_807989 [Exidia glandulosa HHB12029]